MSTIIAGSSRGSLEEQHHSNLLKNEHVCCWTEECERAFVDLKKEIIEEPILALPNHTKTFEVRTDAFNFTIDGVLMQEGHPIAYESRKLNDTGRRYTVQEKEMTAMGHCIQTWHHYLLGSRFVARTDNC